MNQLLRLENLKVYVENSEILRGVNLEVNSGEFHVLMGQNGSGKSTLALTIMGHPRYRAEGVMEYKGDDLKSLSVDERARRGIFLAFQHPAEIEGVRIIDYARLVLEKGRSVPREKSYDMVVEKGMEVNLTEEELKRYINVGFSGGERKRIELLLALLLEPDLVILDEPDSGVDVDSLSLISKKLHEMQKSGKSVLLITHYGRILQHVDSSEVKVHVMRKGKIVISGYRDLVRKIEEQGFDSLFKECGCNE